MTISNLNRIGSFAQSHAKQRPAIADPVPNWRQHITSHQGHRANPFSGGGGETHNGMDIAVPHGTPIQAVKPGKVVFAGEQGSYGNLVVLQHNDGTFTKYAHQSKLNVQVGQDVQAGDVIGAVGSTGRSTGAHLHFEVRKGSPNGELLDPTAYLEGAEKVAAHAPEGGYSPAGDSRGSATGGGTASTMDLPGGGGLVGASSGGGGAVSSPGFSGTLSGVSEGGVDGMWDQLAKYGIDKEWMRKLLEELGIPASEIEKMMTLVLGVIKQESGGNQGARSPVGAMGLMQLMPATASGLGVNPGDAKDNVRGGVTYLMQQLKAFGNDVPKALAAYNAGPGNVQKYGGVPPFAETQKYVQNITRSVGLA